MITIHAQLIDSVNKEKKDSLSGQMSLFDLVGEEEKKEFELSYPDVGEFDKEIMLGFEKEVLGIYLSGHPLEEYIDKMKKSVTAQATDFMIDADTNETKIADGEKVIVGGLISEKTEKYTKRNQAMGIFTLEDLSGAVEVLVFAKSYERYKPYIQTDAKVFVTGRASVEADSEGKIICDRIIPFDETQKDLWLRFETVEDYEAKETEIMNLLRGSDGRDEVIIYINADKAMKRLGSRMSVKADSDLIALLSQVIPEKDIVVQEKKITT